FPATPSLALGAGEVTLLELTSAYATFANAGGGVWAYGIEEIRDRAGRVLYRRQGSGPGRVAAETDVGAITGMLAKAIEAGTGRAAAIDRPVAGKTGTSQNFRDAWFLGFSADLVAGVWMGNDDARPMKAVTGGGAPALLWHDFMLTAHSGLAVRPLPGTHRETTPESPATAGQPGFWGKLFGTASGQPG
ncbi:MAG: carboxypeptidase, partial [Rhodospirillales bacterium]|nr:carboxypeptidase [Rhodospirillales bacterium]